MRTNKPEQKTIPDNATMGYPTPAPPPPPPPPGYTPPQPPPLPLSSDNTDARLRHAAGLSVVPTADAPRPGGGAHDEITHLRDLASAAKVELREAAWFLTRLTTGDAPAKPLRRLRGTLEVIAAMSRHMIDDLKDDAWEDLRLPKLLTRELTGFDQHLHTEEQREAMWNTACEREAALIEEHQRQHPDEAHCEDCGGIGFLHTDDAYGRLIWPCDACEKYSDHVEAVLAHRELCGCNYPEFDGESYNERGIRLEKGYELVGIKCPRCGQAHDFLLEAKQTILIQDCKPLEDDEIQFDGKTETKCVACEHSGVLSEFCPNVSY